MSLKPRDLRDVPEDTAKLALRMQRRKPNRYVTLRDRLGPVFADADFAALYTSPRGRPAEAPALLALVLLLQFLEDLDDAAAAEMVGQRVDWKYLLGLALDDVGFDASVLCEFRERLAESGQVQLFLDRILELARAEGLLQKRGQQRSDSTAVLGYVRELNRLELVASTMHAALESVAVCAPQWLKRWVPAAWGERYGQRIENYRLPRDKAARRELAQRIGADGFQLLAACYAPDAPAYLRAVEAVEILRRVWIQQYYVDDDNLRWRRQEELPPHALLICSPYESEARYATKRDTHWTGYKVHLTETCDPAMPRLITHVATTPSTTTDDRVTPQIHADLAARDLLPSAHFVDTGYVNARGLVSSAADYDVALLGPLPADPSWQGRAQAGFDLPQFAIDWDAHVVTCPVGTPSSCWSLGKHPKYADPVVHVRFPRATCQACRARETCTHSRQDGRTLTFLPPELHAAQQARRQELQTQAFWDRYKVRSGIEGTLSQALRGFGMRRARYRGLAKTQLQNVLTACALNVARLLEWFADHRPRSTRSSHLVRLMAAPA